jgi:hypothetical protein
VVAAAASPRGCAVAVMSVSVSVSLSQSAFSPAHLVPGIEPSEDKMLQVCEHALLLTVWRHMSTRKVRCAVRRVCSATATRTATDWAPTTCRFRSTARSLRGCASFLVAVMARESVVLWRATAVACDDHWALCCGVQRLQARNHQRDGFMTVDGNQGGAANYLPNSAGCVLHRSLCSCFANPVPQSRRRLPHSASARLSTHHVASLASFFTSACYPCHYPPVNPPRVSLRPALVSALNHVLLCSPAVTPA